MPDCESNHQFLPNETNVAPDWEMPRPCSVCALPSREPFIQTADCLCFVRNSTSWINKAVLKLRVNCSACTNRILCLSLGFWAFSEPYPLVSAGVTADIVSSSCWWLLFFSLSRRSRMGLIYPQIRFLSSSVRLHSYSVIWSAWKRGAARKKDI